MDAVGGLFKVGEKSRTRVGEVFVNIPGCGDRRAGCSSHQVIGGLAFNEIDATCENGQKAYKRYDDCSVDAARCRRTFHKAWRDGMDAPRLDIDKECYAPR